MHIKGMISIWFFIGALLLIYGVLILIASLFPSDRPVVLAELHVGIYWGVLLIVLGAIYSFKFRPGRTD